MEHFPKWNRFINESVEKLYVHGYVKPENSFYTLSEKIYLLIKC